MISLPDKIEVCPITESILEIRFNSKYPKDAIFGMVYSDIKDSLTDAPIPLPILQLPETVRNQDPNLIYQATYQIGKGNSNLKIGPKVINFGTAKPYPGWDEWSKFFYEILEKIFSSDVVSQVERIGLRYINFFDTEIFDKVKLDVKLINTKLKSESTNIRTEIIDDNFIKILQIGNLVNMTAGANKKYGSVIDIDCIYNFESSSTHCNYKEVIEDAHVKEKTLFFSLLEENFLKELKPIYGGN